MSGALDRLANGDHGREPTGATEPTWEEGYKVFSRARLGWRAQQTKSLLLSGRLPHTHKNNVRI